MLFAPIHIIYEPLRALSWDFKGRAISVAKNSSRVSQIRGFA